jgi:ribosome modulation factor
MTRRSKLLKVSLAPVWDEKSAKTTIHNDLKSIGYEPLPTMPNSISREYIGRTPIVQPAMVAKRNDVFAKHGLTVRDTDPPSWDNGRAVVELHKHKDWRKHKLKVTDPDNPHKGDLDWRPTPEHVKQADYIQPKKKAGPVKNTTITLSSVRTDLLASLAAVETAGEHWLQGFKAGKAGKMKSDCPHQPKTPEHRDWHHGHKVGSRDFK